MITNQKITVLSSATRNANGSVVLNTRHVEAMDLYLKVTALTGTTPTLDVTVTYEDPASGDTISLVSFTQASGATTETKSLPALLPEEVTIAWTIGGTVSPTVTFSLGGLRRLR